jgi:hypothetical protein
MGIKELLAQQDASFVSLCHLLMTMVESDGCTLQETAQVLLRLLNQSDRKDRPRWISHSKSHGDVLVEATVPLASLRRLVEHGRFEREPEPGDIRSDYDYDSYGFKADAIYDFLDRHGVTLKRPDAVNLLPARQHLAWTLPYRAMPAFSVEEAAHILAGLDPHGTEVRRAADVDRALQRYKRMLFLAIDYGHLTGGVWGDDRDQQEISHADLRTWCEEHDQPWLIPPLTRPPANDAELMERLGAAERACAVAEQEVERLRPVAAERDRLRARETDLTVEVVRLTGELAKAQAKLDLLQQDQLQGKRRSTALRLIGGLVMVTYAADLHAGRFMHMSEMLDDLAAKGIIISEGTVHSYLTEAANEIGRPSAHELRR